MKQASYRAAMAIARRHMPNMSGRASGRRPWLAAAYRLARTLVFKPMLMKVGLHNVCSAALTAGAPIPPTVQAIWQIWGVNLRNLYGITEHTLVLCQSEPFQEPGDAGVPLYPKEVVLGRRRRNPGARPRHVLRLLEKRGSHRAGDPGRLVSHWRRRRENGNGHFRIVDRKKDIMVTSGGKNISPSEVENLLKGSSYISEAVLFADGRKFPSALIEIDFDTVSDWARHTASSTRASPRWRSIRA